MSRPRSRAVSANVEATRRSISGPSGARVVRMGTAIVEISEACAAAWAGAHVTMTSSARAHLEIMSDTTTRGIRIEVESEYLADRSDRETYYFAYHVRISNVGSEAAQLVSREWIITDADGKVERVQGPGVVGEFPLLEPGESFEYTSFCPLTTEVGTMEGQYVMVVVESGEPFEAEIGRFTLAAPGAVN